MVRGDGDHQPGERLTSACVPRRYVCEEDSLRDSGFPSSGAGATGGGAGGDDPAASLPVHDPPPRDGHVQPERKYD